MRSVREIILHKTNLAFPYQRSQRKISLKRPQGILLPQRSVPLILRIGRETILHKMNWAFPYQS
jgi:hypothetical protein